jgi:hypothetical protein
MKARPSPRADGEKTDPRHFRGLLAGHLAAAQEAETSQDHAPLQKLSAAMAAHRSRPFSIDHGVSSFPCNAK